MILKIPKCYVSDNCVQIKIPFNKNITLISSDFYNEGILCHYDFNSDSQNINSYLSDERRRQFPYANIPMYKGLYWELFEETQEVYYVNQILEFNKHYISITDDFCIMDRYVVKDKEEAILFSRRLYMPKTLEEKDINKKEMFNEFADNVLACINRDGQYINFKKDLRKFYNSLGGILILNDNGKITFKVIKLTVRGHFYFKKEYDIPFNNYKIEELKCFDSKIVNIKEPIIFLKLNPNIERKDIKEAKKLVRELNRGK